MKILLTGASGFIGQAVCDRAQGSRHEFLSYGRSKNNNGTLEHLSGDILNHGEFQQALNHFQPEVIVHLAANCDRSRSVVSLHDMALTNIFPLLTIIQNAASRTHAPFIIQMGTAEEYGPQPAPFHESLPPKPTNPYSWSKSSASTALAMAWDLWRVPSMTLRASIAYGPKQGESMFIPYVISSLLRQEAPPMTAGEQVRDFVYIDDVVDAIFKSIDRGLQGHHVANIASGKPVTLKQVALKIAGLISNGVAPNIGVLPYRKGEIMDYRCDVSLASSLLGWTPKTSLDDGLRLTIDALKQKS